MDVWSKRTTFSRSHKARQRVKQGRARMWQLRNQPHMMAHALVCSFTRCHKGSPEGGAFARKHGVHHTPSRADASCAAHCEQHMHLSDEERRICTGAQQGHPHSVVLWRLADYASCPIQFNSLSHGTMTLTQQARPQAPRAAIGGHSRLLPKHVYTHVTNDVEDASE